MEIDGEVYIFRYRRARRFPDKAAQIECRLQEDGRFRRLRSQAAGSMADRAFLQSIHICLYRMPSHRERPQRCRHVVEPALGEMFPKLPADMPYITEEEDTDYEKGFKPYITNLREVQCGFNICFDGMRKRSRWNSGTGKTGAA